MSEALSLVWFRPWWLAAVPLGIALAVWLVRRGRGLGAWERAADPHLLAEMRRLGRVSDGGAPGAWALGALVAILGLALAGPAGERRDAPALRNLDGLVLVVDLSPSVVESGRLLDALAAARLVADSAAPRQTALVVYAGEGYLAAPLTSDIRALGGTIALLGADTVPVSGSRPSAGLAEARNVIAETDLIATDVVLLSDGAGLDDAVGAEARALVAAGARLFTIQIPTGDQTATPERAQALAALAEAGGGLAGSLADPFRVAAEVGARPLERLADSGYAMLLVEDLGRMLLVLALVPAALLLPRRRLG